MIEFNNAVLINNLEFKYIINQSMQFNCKKYCLTSLLIFQKYINSMFHDNCVLILY